MDELVREALREGRLTVAGGGPAALYTPWAVGFEKQYPGITVQVRGAFSNQLVADIDRQLESGGPTVDVAILQTLQDFLRWKAAGALLEIETSAAEHLAPEWRDVDGRYLPIGVFGLVYGYDPRQVLAEEIPRSAPGFTDPRWRGCVTSTYPHEDDVTLYLYSALVERHGWPFIDQLLATSPQFVNGHLGVAQGLAAGTAALSFDHIISLGAADRQAGRLAFTIPPEDPMPVWPQNAAILDGSPSPAAAKLFLRWLLEPDQQNAIARAAPGHHAWTSRRRRAWRRWPSSTSRTDSCLSSRTPPPRRPTGTGSRHSSDRSPAPNTAERTSRPSPVLSRVTRRVPLESNSCFRQATSIR